MISVDRKRGTGWHYHMAASMACGKRRRVQVRFPVQKLPRLPTAYDLDARRFC